MEFGQNFYVSVLALIVIYFIAKSILGKKNIKDFKMSFGFFKGFEFSSSYYEPHKE